MKTCFLISNCHLGGLVGGIKFHNPDVRLDACHVWNLATRFGTPEHLLDFIRNFDTVFTMRFGAEFMFGINSDVIAEAAKETVFYPTVNFAGFHPDVVYLFERDSNYCRFVVSPLGPFNSALALYGFRRGYSVERTAGLFRGEVYDQLGYFSGWEEAVAGLLADRDARDFGFESHLLHWLRQGCFMYNPQHPRLGPVLDIAREILRRADLAVLPGHAEGYLASDLVPGPIWPVYPEIAARFGLPGDMVFKPEHGGQAEPHYHRLETFLGKSFEAFGRYDLDDHPCERVEGWLRDGVDV